MPTQEERLTAWQNNTPPPSDKPFLYNGFATLGSNQVVIGGEVRFDHQLQQYVF